MSPQLQKTEDWNEDFGDSIFFHFYSFEEPPHAYCGSPLETDFNEKY